MDKLYWMCGGFFLGLVLAKTGITDNYSLLSISVMLGIWVLVLFLSFIIRKDTVNEE